MVAIDHCNYMHWVCIATWKVMCAVRLWGRGGIIAGWKTYLLFFVIQESNCTPVPSSTFSIGFSPTSSLAPSPSFLDITSGTVTTAGNCSLSQQLLSCDYYNMQLGWKGKPVYSLTNKYPWAEYLKGLSKWTLFQVFHNQPRIAPISCSQWLNVLKANYFLSLVYAETEQASSKDSDDVATASIVIAVISLLTSVTTTVIMVCFVVQPLTTNH